MSKKTAKENGRRRFTQKDRGSAVCGALNLSRTKAAYDALGDLPAEDDPQNGAGNEDIIP